MKAAIYTRKSKFSPTGDSIENQFQLCKEYALQNIKSLKIDEFIEYEDEGYSGGNTNRPSFQNLIEDAKNKKFDILICYRLDRISRNVSDFSTTLALLQNYNIDFISIREQFDTTTPMGRAMIYIASVFAQLERETIAERVKDNMLELAKTGRWLGGTAPLGYKSEPVTYLDENMNEKTLSKLIIVPDELEVVKLIFEKYLELKSLAKVEAYFLKNHYTTRRGAKFDKTKLVRILTNTVYVKSSDKVIEYLSSQNITICGNPDGIHGILTYNKLKPALTRDGQTTREMRDTSDWIAAVSSHKGVISDSDWLEAQKIREGNKDRFTVSARTHNALLTGIIKCDVCGAPMRILHGVINKKTGKRFYYYVCSAKRDSKGTICTNPNGKVETIDRIIIDNIKQLGKNKVTLIDNLKKSNKQEIKQAKKENKENNILNLINQKKLQIDNLLNKISLDTDLADLIIPKIKTLKEEIKTLELEKLNSNDSLQDLEAKELSLSFIELLLNKCSLVDTLSFDEKKTLLRGLTENISWNGNTSELNISFMGSEDSKKK